MDPLLISSLRGGLNQHDPPIALPADQVVTAENIDFDRSTLGGRRGGHTAVTTSGLTGAVVALARHFPVNDETQTQLWAVSVSGSSSAFTYKDASWHDETPTGSEALDVSRGQYGGVRACSLHNKLFLAYPTASGTDRLHVWDGSTLRATGLAEPAAPSVSSSGSGGYSTTRYFRVRYTAQDGSGHTLRRSEPSDATTFTPSGTGAGATVTKPAAISEGETHWEVEESIDDANFYRIATVAVGTTTYTDTLASTAVADQPLSEDTGAYTLQYNPRFLLAVDDRLMMGGAWEQPALESRIAWTPVGTDPGVGDDERTDETQDPFMDLDAGAGGGLTDLAGPLNGYAHAFKRGHIYRLVRTGTRSAAYQAIPLTDKSGALPGSVVMGLDEGGASCLYYLDHAHGPSRIGVNGIQTCGVDISETWAGVNQNADLVCHGVYYPDLRQVWWWVAESGESTPTLRLKAHVRQFRNGDEGVRRGWSLDTGDYQATLCSVLYAENIEADTDRSLTLKPLVGTAISGALIAQANSGTTDNGTDFQARIVTKPFVPMAMLSKFGVRAGVLTAAAASGVSVQVTLSGQNEQTTNTATKTVDLSPAATEPTVIRLLDDLALDENLMLQVEMGDATAVDADWALQGLALMTTDQESF